MEKIVNSNKFRAAGKVCGILMYLISAAMLVFSTYLCFSPDIWYDELFSVQFAMRPILEMIRLTAADVHPPLYYIILHAFALLSGIGGGTPVDGAVEAAGFVNASVPVLKLASVIPFIILFIYGITVIRKRYGVFFGGLFSMTAIAMPQITEYAVEIRMYSWVMLFVTGFCIHAKDFLETDKERQIKGLRWGKMFPLFMYGLMACYTQYYAVPAIFVLYIILIIWSIRKNVYQLGILLISANMTAVAYVPWIGAVLSQAKSVSGGYWIQPLSWRSFGGIIKYLMKPAFFNDKLATVLAVVMFIYVAFAVITNFRDIYMWVCFAPIIAIIAFGFAASFILGPVFTYRYMMPGIAAMWLGVLVSIWRNTCYNASKCSTEDDGKSPGGFNIRVVTCMILAVLMIVFCICDFWAFRGNELYKRVNMVKTEEFFEGDFEDTVIICNFDQVAAINLYYLNHMGDIALESGEKAEIPVYLYGAMTDVYLQTIIPGIRVIDKPSDVKSFVDSGKRVLFLGSFNSREDILKEWKEAEGIDNTNQGSYLLERYWFDVFELS